MYIGFGNDPEELIRLVENLSPSESRELWWWLLAMLIVGPFILFFILIILS